MNNDESNKVSMMRVRNDTKVLIDEIRVLNRMRMSFDSVIYTLAKQEIARLKGINNER